MPWAEELCTRTTQIKQEEVFISLKRKVDVPIGSEFISHRPDKINISQPCVQTGSTRIDPIDLSSSPIDLSNSSILAINHVVRHKAKVNTLALGIHHVTPVQETTCHKSQRHIARLPKSSAKAYFTQQAITMKKCVAWIIQDGKSTVPPAYTDLMDNYRKEMKKKMQLFSCNNDIVRCVKGTRRRWVLSRPDLPKVWHVKRGTNLKCKGILALENVGFRFPQREVISPRRLFHDHNIPVDLSRYVIRAFHDEAPKQCKARM